MKKLLSCACAALLTMAAVSPCFAADSAWNGTWKMNLEKSKVNGGTVIITAKGAGYNFSNGSTINYDFACDGKSYPTSGNGTLSCTVASDGAYDIVMANAGTVTQKATGPLVTPGTTVTYKAAGPNKVMVTTKLNGKVMSEGTWTLSADGKSYTQESWLPGKEKEKVVLVFEKQ